LVFSGREFIRGQSDGMLAINQGFFKKPTLVSFPPSGEMNFQKSQPLTAFQLRPRSVISV
jgi:hypothetical protein